MTAVICRVAPVVCCRLSVSLRFVTVGSCTGIHSEGPLGLSLSPTVPVCGVLVAGLRGLVLSFRYVISILGDDVPSGSAPASVVVSGHDLPPASDAAHLLQWEPKRQFDVWHDRAVFHFLTDSGDRKHYVRTLRRSLREGGHAIVGTFAADGPDYCSNLPTARYDADRLSGAFGDGFTRVIDRREQHQTPAGTEQPFTWVVLRRS